MSLNDLFDGKTMVMAVVGSLTAYVFYGHIKTSALVDTIVTKQEQVIGEQKDLWGKYNGDRQQSVSTLYSGKAQSGYLHGMCERGAQRHGPGRPGGR